MSYISEIRLQVIDDAQENCSWYGELASGRRIYAYARNDPINGVDPSGLAVEGVLNSAGNAWAVVKGAASQPSVVAFAQGTVAAGTSLVNSRNVITVGGAGLAVLGALLQI
jgi:uncharacterized protein RhaS with RHS repeats